MSSWLRRKCEYGLVPQLIINNDTPSAVHTNPEENGECLGAAV